LATHDVAAVENLGSRHHQPPTLSCPALCRASTNFFANKQTWMAGQPGHDEE
jgi:hypothetical protein